MGRKGAKPCTIDLNGAFDGKMGNHASRKIIRSVKIPVQVGGGLRNVGDIKKLDTGAARVIIGLPQC